MAWSSPNWVDYIPGSAKGKSVVKARATKPVKQAAFVEEEEDEDFEEDDYEDYESEE